MKKLGDKIVSYLLALGMLVSCCSSGLTVNAMSMDVASSTDATTTITEETTDETDITTEDVYSSEITSEGTNDIISDNTASSTESSAPQDGDNFTVNQTNLNGNQSAAEAQGNFYVSMNGAIQSGYSDWTAVKM